MPETSKVTPLSATALGNGPGLDSTAPGTQEN
jgi:hypothetical protein